MGLAAGGYRLPRQPPRPARNAAVGLWLVNGALIGGWAELFFRKKVLGPSAALSGAMPYPSPPSSSRRRGATQRPPHSAAWLSFATVLATDIWRTNRSTD